MKKLTVIASLSTALLASSAAQADWRGNWLFGVSGAYNWYEGNIDHAYNATQPAVAAVASVFGNENFDSKRWSWGLLGGYQIRYAQWLFGAEVNVDWQDHDHSKSFNHSFAVPGTTISHNITAELNRDTTWGLTARIGYEVLPCFFPYIRLGAVRHDHDLSFTGASNFLLATGGSTLAIADDSSHNWRFIGGIGAEAPLTFFPYLSGLTFRVEYNYIDNKHVDVTGAWAGVTGPLVATSTFHVREHTNVVKASLVYNFTI